MRSEYGEGKRVLAAVVSDTSRPPAFADFEDPVAEPGEVIVDVAFAAQSSLAKAQASGKHYSSRTQLPFVPGIDGVGTRADGTPVYFAFPRAPFGSMAAKVPIRENLCIPLPPGLDTALAAAAGNPGMSSAAALIERAKYVAGESVLVNGATSYSGRFAVSFAKFLGAREIVATGRNEAMLGTLAALGATATIPLAGPHDSLVDVLRTTLRERKVAIVLDYLWGAPAASLIEAITGEGSEHAEPRIRYVQIGASAGAEIALPAKALRSSGLELLGSGLGSVSYERLIAATAAFFSAAATARLTIDARIEPLADVERLWNGRTDEGRLVFACSA